MRLCPRSDCDQHLVEDDFWPPGAWRCPVHGGPIWLDTDVDLVDWPPRPNTRFGDPPEHRTEQEVITHWLSRLAASGKLRHSIAHDLAGELPTVVTIENHGPEQIDIRLYFDAQTGALADVQAHTDRRQK